MCCTEHHAYNMGSACLECDGNATVVVKLAVRHDQGILCVKCIRTRIAIGYVTHLREKGHIQTTNAISTRKVGSQR
jgi:ribosomal protein S17E